MDGSLVFEVFSLVIGAGPFAFFGAGGTDEINLLKSGTFGGDDLLYLLEIIGMVGDDA